MVDDEELVDDEDLLDDEELLDDTLEELFEVDEPMLEYVHVFDGSSGLLFPSSSSKESGARVHAGASEVSVPVVVSVVVVS